MPIHKGYLIALALAIAIFGAVKITNPYKKYSTAEFWEQATVASVREVPQKALQPGNRNGGVLMWAAMGTSDIAVIRELVYRGADVNESDPQFSGTPLSAAAGYGRSPQIITELARLGGDVNKTVNNNETPLMIAARFNHNPGFVEALVAAGAEIDAKNAQGATAMKIAVRNQNTTVEQALRDLKKSQRESASTRQRE